MRVARLHGPGDIRLSDEPPPVRTEGASLVRVEAAGICGSDLHWFDSGGIGDTRLSRPIVPGHELAGVVMEGPQQGALVAIDPALPCGACDSCRAGHPNLCPRIEFAGHGDRDGGLSDLIVWPDRALHAVPASMSALDAAMLEPLGVAIHAMDLAHPRPAMSIGVLGCGPIGLLLVQLARITGAGQVVVTDVLTHRRDAALDSGADLAFDPADLPVLNLDVVIEAAGAEGAVVDAMRVARPGGRVVLTGIPDADRISFPASTARRKGLTIIMARRMKDVYPRAITLVQRRMVDVAAVIGARFGIEQVGAAFRYAAGRSGLKTVITFEH